MEWVDRSGGGGRGRLTRDQVKDTTGWEKTQGHMVDVCEQGMGQMAKDLGQHLRPAERHLHVKAWDNKGEQSRDSMGRSHQDRLKELIMQDRGVGGAF